MSACPALSFLLFVLPLLPLSCLAAKTLTPDEVLGLIVFKADLQDPSGKLSSWNEDDDTPCSWMGVKCDPRSHRVTDVNLEGFSLSGRIGRGILQLQYLRKLSLSRNNLTGHIPYGIATLESLRILDFSDNRLSGPLPDFSHQCRSLRSISLARNSFMGSIPDSMSLCTGLVSLDLSSNEISGLLPPSLWKLTSLRSLNLSANWLEGEIPRGIETLKNLRVLSLSKNNFSGSIPDGIGSCQLLKVLDLSENSFSGSVPPTLQKLVMCTWLNLSNNGLTGDVPYWIGEMKNIEILDLSVNRLSGKVPHSLGNAMSLKVLNMSQNNLSGSLPRSMENCSNLQAMDFSQNMMTGDLPLWVFGSFVGKALFFDSKLRGVNSISLPNFQLLDLSSNSFSGKISSFIGSLNTMQVLNLSGNNLSGAIPQTIGDLVELRSLDLSRNDLIGGIPVEIGGASSLQDLRLNGNRLTGNIPANLGNCSSLAHLILSGNNFSGSIPAEMAMLSNLQYVDLSYNSLEGTIPKQLSGLSNLFVFNVSHNNLQGELPSDGFFNTISPSSISDNPLLCGAMATKSCPAVLPKPIVLNPNSSSDDGSSVLPNSLGHKRIILSISALIAIGAAAVILVGVITVSVLNLRVRSLAPKSPSSQASSRGNDFSGGSPITDANSGKLVMFSGEPHFSAGAHALLSKDCELGRGGFGSVYRTVLQNGHEVAIKKLTVSSLVKSQDDFEREVKKLGKIRHPNLVALNGYYWTPSLQLLIYEYISGGSLHKRLHDSHSLFSWSERFNVILGTAKGLAQLHKQSIIHYNIKSSNVLIDISGEAKLCDYGLAKLLPMLDRYVLSSKVQSALGYMAPEFACRTVKITEKCDVYGFGALILEVLTGKMPVEYMEDDVVVLCDLVRGNLENGRVEECMDDRLSGEFPTEEAVPVIKLGLICTSQVPSNRPDMGEVVRILELIRCPAED